MWLYCERFVKLCLKRLFFIHFEYRRPLCWLKNLISSESGMMLISIINSLLSEMLQDEIELRQITVGILLFREIDLIRF
jgi:hypothetical protein